ncbi:hypothetical protein [Halospeciosus flavus]|uniref:hypothetical protein n=1 Tax=Halospeciosus flavus TaxID=3032283 RepID=UPI0036087BD8
MSHEHGLEAGDEIRDIGFGKLSTVREVGEEGDVFWEADRKDGESANQVAARLESGRYEIV